MKLYEAKLILEQKKNYRHKSEVYILDNKNNIYVAKTKFGWHTIPGGGIDEGEDPQVAAKRECMEEIGVKISNLKPIDNNPQCFKGCIKPGYYGTCTHSYKADFVKVIKSGIEDHLKLDIITIPEMIKSCELAIKSNNKDWALMYIFKNRLKLLKSLQKRDL